MPWLVSGLATWLFSSLFPNVFNALWDLCKDLIFYLFGLSLDFMISVVNSIDTPLNVLDISRYVALLKPEWVAYLSYLGFFEAVSIVVTAIIIRTSIIMIPFIGRLVR